MATNDGNFIDDPTGFSGTEFSLAYWWASHKDQLKKWWVMIFAVLVTGVVLYDLFYITIHAVTWTGHNRVITGIVDNAISVSPDAVSVTAIALQTGDVSVTQEFDDHADFIVSVVNPNETWAVEEVQYRFNYAGGQTSLQTAQLLPFEEKYLYIKNVNVGGASIDTATIELVDIRWRRTTLEEIRAPEFQVNDIEVSETVTTDDRLISRVDANVRNVSVRSFDAVVFMVLLLDSGGDVVAIQEQTISDFDSLEQEKLIVTFSQQYSSAVTAEILPQLEIL